MTRKRSAPQPSRVGARLAFYASTSGSIITSMRSSSFLRQAQELSMACQGGDDAESFGRRVKDVMGLLDAFGWAKFPLDPTEDVV